MKIRQFKYSRDNFAYLVYDDSHALAIDGGAVAPIQSFIADRGLELRYVTHTHQHADHTSGTSALMGATGAQRLDFTNLQGTKAITWESDDKPVLKVWPSPGHTMDSVVFEGDSFLITGDTLFNGTVGNCFSGDLDRFYASIKKIMAFPDETIIYAGHDYVRESIAFARMLEPDNPHLEPYLAEYDPDHVYSTLGAERTVNPFLRFNTPGLIALMEREGLAVDTEIARWHGVMRLG